MLLMFRKSRRDNMCYQVIERTQFALPNAPCSVPDTLTGGYMMFIRNNIHVHEQENKHHLQTTLNHAHQPRFNLDCLKLPSSFQDMIMHVEMHMEYLEDLTEVEFK
jgi:hypothetical protein